MPIDLKPYLGPYGLLECDKLDVDGENAILYSIYYLAASNDIDYHAIVEDIIATKLHFGPGLYHSRWNDKGQISHDNITSLVFMLDDERRAALWKEIKRQWGRYDDQTPESPKWSRFLHPRDLIYYAILGGSKIAWLFFPVFATISLLSCGESIDKNGVIGTTGKLLFWLRCKTMSDSKLFGLLFKVGTWMIGRNVLKTWQENFKYFFKGNVNHPCVKALDI